MKRTIIIAEAGVNHNGDIARALEMIRVAAWAGADYIKFQTFKTELVVDAYALQAEYQQKNFKTDTQHEMLKKLELSEADHILLFEECRKNKIGFLSTAFDSDSLKFLNKIGLDYIKIPSGEITNLPYIRHIANINKRTIVSTGMTTMDEVEKTIKILITEGLSEENITVLHCTTEYPCPFEDVNLKAMLSMKEKFGLSIGYSDHTEGIEIPIAAVALGAEIIEKHFTLDRNLPGPDHKASLEPEELKKMVSGIRNIEKSLGNGVKAPSASEKKNIYPARRSIFIKKEINKGEIITENHLIALRPGDGISAMEWNNVIGREALKNMEAGHKLHFSDFK